MIRRLIHAEHGQALMLSLLSLVVLSLTTAALLTATAVNHRSASVSASAKKAFALAEQGLAYAEGRLYTAPVTAESVLVPGTSLAAGDGQGTISYHGTLCTPTTTPACSPKVWTLYGTGTVNGVSRTVSAQVTIPAVQQTTTTTSTSTTSSTSSDWTIWHYIYLSGSGCTNLAGNVTFNLPLYTEGCLTMAGNYKFTGSDLEVAGSLALTGNAKIGSSSQPISKMNVAGACSPTPCDGNHSPIWVNLPGVGHTLTPVLTKPVISLPTTYAAANPGPATGHSCQAGSNVPTNFFDNDHTLNDSLGNVNLFPSGVAYDCKVGSNEIKWDGSSNLTVNGTFYFDGNLSMAANQKFVYSGLGTIYFTGTMSWAGNSTFCGIANCTTQWDTNHNVLVLVAGCQNSSGGSITSGCVSLSGNNTLQVGIYSNTDYYAGGNATNMGPVIATTGGWGGNATQMIPFATLPSGAPTDTSTTTVTTTSTVIGTTTVDGNPQSPTNWNG